MNQSPAGNLLSRLEGIRKNGPGRWMARCPAHSDRTPSLAIREMDDGRLLIHCFAGCSAEDIVGLAGLDLADLFPPARNRPPPEDHRYGSVANTFPEAYRYQFWRETRMDLIVLSLAFSRFASNQPLSREDAAYLASCADALVDRITREALCG